MNKFLMGALFIAVFNLAAAYADEAKDQSNEIPAQQEQVKSFLESQTLEDIQNMVQFDQKLLTEGNESAG